MQEIEIEYKNLLTEHEFKQLLAHLDFPETAATQTNHYFETPAFSLGKKGCALRIREKKNQYVLTLKEPHSDGLLETHDALGPNEAQAWLQGDMVPKPHTASRLEKMNIHLSDLEYKGKLKTERREFTRKDITFVLDDSTYHGKRDFELEVEALTVETGTKAFHDLLEKFHIPKRSTQNKIQRFFHAI